MNSTKLKDRISKEQFMEYISKIQRNKKMCSDIYETSDELIDVYELVDRFVQPYKLLEKIVFNDIEREFIDWFIYEYNQDMMKIYNTNTNEVIADIQTEEDLWEYLNRE